MHYARLWRSTERREGYGPVAKRTLQGVVKEKREESFVFQHQAHCGTILQNGTLPFFTIEADMFLIVKSKWEAADDGKGRSDR